MADAAPPEPELIAKIQAMVDDLRAAGGAPAISGHLRVDTGGRTRDLLLGSRTVGGVVLDWRTAPLAEVFFRCAPGDEYELDVDGREVTGRVVAKHRVHVGGDGAVHVHAGPALDARAAVSHGVVEIVLDADQRRAVELPAGTSVVVDGEAGVGKTLVAMYRLARLHAHAQPGWRALVLVPTEGLRRLCVQLIDRVGLDGAGIEVAIVDDWLFARARSAFARLPDRLAQDASAATIRLKRHPAVRAVLDELLARPRARDDDERKLPRARADLLHLWGDRARLDAIVAEARGALDARAITDTLAHTHVQFTSTTEESHRHVDADRLVTVDGRAIDDGTPIEDAGTIDAEDVPVLFELARRRGKKLELPRYHHVVLDEAQLVAPMELAAIGASLRGGGSFSVAGDPRQETDDSAWFAGWPAAMAELGAERCEHVTLAQTYRSAPPIAAFARELAAAAAPAKLVRGPHLAATAAPTELDQTADICDAVDVMTARDRALQIAIVAHNAEHARRLHRDLARGLDATLVLDGAFTFTPGVVVTTAAQVQGLEFDAVIVPDLSPELWRATPVQRRSLYVAVTRARTWLWLTTARGWSPLVDVA
jgi:hypothetical protein